MTPDQTSTTRRLSFSTDAQLRRRFMVVDEPVMANVRVGLLLEVVDLLAEEAALRYARLTYPECRVVTAAMDKLKIFAPADGNRDMDLRARINFVGRSSMEIGIRVEHPATDDQPAVHVGSCYLTMVTRVRTDGKDVSGALPPLDLSSEADQKRAERAAGRRDASRRDRALVPPTTEEYIMLHALHERRERAEPGILLATDLVTSGWERTYPEYENVPEKIFGGYVMHRAYMYAHICAELVADSRAVLVAADRIDFYQPVRMGDKLKFVSRVTYTGKTSITVETAITRISRDRSVTALSNNCIFIFRNVDSSLNGLPVPQIYPQTYSEDARYLDGFRRRKREQALSPPQH